MYSKEDLLADFRDVRETGNLGISLHKFYRKLKRQISPRAFVTFLDELNKEERVVITAMCWPPVGIDHRTVIKLPLTEWLVLIPNEDDKLYYYHATERWFEKRPPSTAYGYSEFMLYAMDYGLPDDVQALLKSGIR